MKEPESNLKGNLSDDQIQKAIVNVMKELNDIYKNKSSDEYKMAGDITKSPVYDGIESAVANLSTLKGFPKQDVSDYQNLFNALHKPMYKKMVAEYLKSPNEQNTAFTTIFTLGYRTLLGDLSRIYAATEATESGIVYHPDQAAKQRALTKSFIKAFNKNIDDEYNKAVRRNGNKPKMHQEGALFSAIGSGVTALSTFSRAHELGPITAFFRDIFNFIFGARKELNPISFISHRLTKSYDSLVDRFEDTQKMYNATKEAYEEYKNSPGRKDMAIEGRYLRNLKKYNIAMKTLQAKLAHYDSRAQAEAEEKMYKARMEQRQKMKEEAERKASERKENTRPTPKPEPTRPTPSIPKPTTSVPKEMPKPEPSPSEQKPTEEKPKPPKVDTGDLDF